MEPGAVLAGSGAEVTEEEFQRIVDAVAAGIGPRLGTLESEVDRDHDVLNSRTIRVRTRATGIHAIALREAGIEGTPESVRGFRDPTVNSCGMCGDDAKCVLCGYPIEIRDRLVCPNVPTSSEYYSRAFGHAHPACIEKAIMEL